MSIKQILCVHTWLYKHSVKGEYACLDGIGSYDDAFYILQCSKCGKFKRLRTVCYYDQEDKFE